ncbi:unnamed protein product, partial [marine sediment metagenome]
HDSVDNWQNVAEAIPDEDATYNYQPAGGAANIFDLYNLSAPSGSGTINHVTLYRRCKTLGRLGEAEHRWWLKTHGKIYKSGLLAYISADYTTYSNQFITNPHTGLPWTWAEVNALQVGASLPGSSLSGESRLTQVYVEIDYTPPPEQHTISISLVGQGTTDPASGTYIVEEGTILTITAYPDEGWLFDHWEGDVSGINPVLEVQVLKDLSIIAVFEQIPKHVLTIETVGQGTTVPAPGTWEY